MCKITVCTVGFSPLCSKDVSIVGKPRVDAAYKHRLSGLLQKLLVPMSYSYLGKAIGQGFVSAHDFVVRSRLRQAYR